MFHSTKCDLEISAAFSITVHKKNPNQTYPAIPPDKIQTSYMLQTYSFKIYYATLSPQANLHNITASSWLTLIYANWKDS